MQSYSSKVQMLKKKQNKKLTAGNEYDRSFSIAH